MQEKSRPDIGRPIHSFWNFSGIAMRLRILGRDRSPHRGIGPLRRPFESVGLKSTYLRPRGNALAHGLDQVTTQRLATTVTVPELCWLANKICSDRDWKHSCFWLSSAVHTCDRKY